MDSGQLVPGTGYRAPGTVHRPPSTVYRLPSTVYRPLFSHHLKFQLRLHLRVQVQHQGIRTDVFHFIRQQYGWVALYHRKDPTLSRRDVAIDPSWAASFSTLRGSSSEQKLYPNFVLGTEVSELDGHRASVSNTVGAVGVASTDTNVKAFVGDFSAIRWGIQRAIGLEVIRYGDPDGQGDLKRNNQVAFRAEVVYGWGFGDLDAVAKIVDAV